MVTNIYGKNLKRIRHATYMKCPRCNYEISSSPVKKWNFNVYEVSRFFCSNCNSKFNLYEGPEGKSYTIPKREG